MERADTILTGGIVVTMNQQFEVILDGAVVIRDERIIAVGPSDEISRTYAADKVVSCAGQYVIPGLVNAHTHISMTLLRGLADDLRLDVWLMGYVMPTEHEFVNPEFCRLGAKLACAEMIRSGITSFADMYYYEADVAAATVEAGMRGVLGQTILKFPAPDAETYEDSLAYTEKFIQEWKDHPLITPALAPHAPYSTTDDLLRRCGDMARKYDVPVLIHIAETKLEVEDSEKEFGMRVVPRVQATDLLNAKVLAAHCVHIDQREMDMIHQHETTVAHCPTSNLKLASGIAPITQMLERGLTVGIGTDGPASNNDLDMLEEVRLAAILAKTAANNPTAVPAKQALLMATRQGAAALFMEAKTGSLEVGKLADIITIDANPVHNIPQFQRDPDLVYSRIVYASKATDVRHVLVNGKWLMQDRQLLTLNEAELIEQAADYAKKVDAFLAAREGDILSKLLAIGGLEQEESFEVQVKAEIPDASIIDKLLQHPDVHLLRHVHYRQYDTYFMFGDPDQGRVRYREDDLIGEDGEVQSVRSRLTFTKPTKERDFNSTVLLSRSQFISSADRPLRFYREYFQPTREREVHKDRLRWHVHYQGVLFYVNIDRVTEPAQAQTFIEIKSRTWSASDAEYKADRIQEMLGILEVTRQAAIQQDYLELNAPTA